MDGCKSMIILSSCSSNLFYTPLPPILSLRKKCGFLLCIEMLSTKAQPIRPASGLDKLPFCHLFCHEAELDESQPLLLELLVLHDRERLVKAKSVEVQN